MSTSEYKDYPSLPEHPYVLTVFGDFYSEDQMRAYADDTHALRAARAPASSVTAPAGGEIDRLRAALVYVAFALHDTPQHMLAEGITLIDGDTVRVSRDGWTVEASVNPARATPPAQAADSVLEDAARWQELREQHESDEALCCVFAPNDMRECLVPVGSLPGELDAFMDAERAARKQGANHD